MSHRSKTDPPVGRDVRQFARFPTRCRARMQIGNRHYAGYVENLSQGGAKLNTFTPIRVAGNVLLRIPDLPPLRGELRWVKGSAGGVAFSLILSPERLSEWTRTRTRQEVHLQAGESKNAD